ncbi:hypothetical protein M0R45_030731 [Rubus argutus]|uniref:Uncharacterized protein n=1 Tax=Rubus argutus TaxID=59490 RepID=A0AAW1WF46_RUBAR
MAFRRWCSGDVVELVRWRWSLAWVQRCREQRSGTGWEELAVLTEAVDGGRGCREKRRSWRLLLLSGFKLSLTLSRTYQLSSPNLFVTVLVSLVLPHTKTHCEGVVCVKLVDFIHCPELYLVKVFKL